MSAPALASGSASKRLDPRRRLAPALRRLSRIAVVLIGITVVSFLLLHIVPGDPARIALGPRASAAAIEALRHRWGLDRSLPVQYIDYVSRLAHGDFGISITYQVPVRPLIFQALPVTLLMLAVGLVFAVGLALPLALVAATKAGRWPDHIVRGIPLLGLGMPPFWVAYVLLIALTIKLRFFPSGGYGTTFADHLVSLVLPGLTIAIATAPILVRSLRAALIEAMTSDFAIAARSRGLSYRRVLIRHVLRNCLVPLVSTTAVMSGYLLGSTTVIELMFDLPGIGRLLLNGIANRDFDLVQSVALCYAVLVIVLNICVDLAYSALDPRVRLGE
ncbi:MAG TPA: ABC transporter permease [Streptosporangiaceae bacterium]|nr:ABC transporter permease [Streptosporangiaceae bacterium]